jgi:hypothetical protein
MNLGNRCEVILANRMQCPHTELPDDPDHFCRLHRALADGSAPNDNPTPEEQKSRG